MRFKLSSLLLAAGCVLVLNCGCANHLRNIESISQDNRRDVQTSKYELTLTPGVVKDTAYHVEVYKLESAKVQKFEVTTVKELVTPYNWWREFYEVPAGMGLLPVSCALHMCFLCSFGILPYEVPRTINDLAFAGMNPALNWEDSSRSEERIVHMNRKTLSEEVENTRVPVAKQNIMLRFGKQLETYQTDAFGSFDLNFLILDSKQEMQRKVDFIIKSPQGEEVLKSTFLTRKYLAKLNAAKDDILSYRANPSGEKLFNLVISLEDKGFEQLAYQLEEAELKKWKNNKKFQDEFRRAIRH